MPKKTKPKSKSTTIEALKITKVKGGIKIQLLK